jgi:hypothetical protein
MNLTFAPKYLLFGLLLLSLPLAATERRTAYAELDGGAVFQGVNDVEIPSGAATRFSLVSFSPGPWATGRAYLGYEFLKNHELRGLYAPLAVEASGVSATDISYQGQTFVAGRSIRARYRFDSYRLTYRYRLVESEKFSLRLGFTGKIRDAEITLFQDNLYATRANVGFVPLLHVNLRYEMTPIWAVELDADALASPYGRAEDISLKVIHKLHENWDISAGYRTVEGGSRGGGSVYNFTWLHYAEVGIRYSF